MQKYFWRPKNLVVFTSKQFKILKRENGVDSSEYELLYESKFKPSELGETLHIFKVENKFLQTSLVLPDSMFVFYKLELFIKDVSGDQDQFIASQLEKKTDSLPDDWSYDVVHKDKEKVFVLAYIASGEKFEVVKNAFKLAKIDVDAIKPRLVYDFYLKTKVNTQSLKKETPKPEPAEIKKDEAPESSRPGSSFGLSAQGRRLLSSLRREQNPSPRQHSLWWRTAEAENSSRSPGLRPQSSAKGDKKPKPQIKENEKTDPKTDLQEFMDLPFDSGKSRSGILNLEGVHVFSPWMIIIFFFIFIFASILVVGFISLRSKIDISEIETPQTTQEVAPPSTTVPTLEVEESADQIDISALNFSVSGVESSGDDIINIENILLAEGALSIVKDNTTEEVQEETLIHFGDRVPKEIKDKILKSLGAEYLLSEGELAGESKYDIVIIVGRAKIEI